MRPIAIPFRSKPTPARGRSRALPERSPRTIRLETQQKEGAHGRKPSEARIPRAAPCLTRLRVGAEIAFLMAKPGDLSALRFDLDETQRIVLRRDGAK